MFKISFLLIIIFSFTTLLAKTELAPNASFHPPFIPYGALKRNVGCAAAGDCQFRVHFYPYCYGTNLRLARKPLRADSTVTAQLNISESSRSRGVSTYYITFPANLTYGSKTAVECPITHGSGSIRYITCTPPGKTVDSTYVIDDWLKTMSHPRAHYRYYKYFLTLLFARTSDPSLPPSQKEISCIYIPNANKTDLLETKVNCLFPNDFTDYTNQVTIQDASKNVISQADITFTAKKNYFMFQFNKGLPQIPIVDVKGGEIVKPTFIPDADLSFTQVGGSQAGYSEAGTNELQWVEEANYFDEGAGYKDLVLVYKFPGQNGFCGGFYSPLMVFFDGKYPTFSGGGNFPLYEGVPFIFWPKENEPGYFLVLKKDDKDISVTSRDQFFGDDKDYENGFIKLAEYDENGDRKIDEKDPVFNKLLLWNDKNANSHAEKNELFSLKQLKITSLSLEYDKSTPLSIEGRAYLRERAAVLYKDKKGKDKKAEIIDVWLAPYPLSPK